MGMTIFHRPKPVRIARSIYGRKFSQRDRNESSPSVTMRWRPSPPRSDWISRGPSKPIVPLEPWWARVKDQDIPVAGTYFPGNDRHHGLVHIGPDIQNLLSLRGFEKT